MTPLPIPRIALALLAIVVACSALATPAFADDGEELTPPRLIYEEDAEYTDDAIDAGIEGGVVLELELAADGSVADVEVLEGLGYGLDESAVEAAYNFEFEPARVDGEAIPVIIDFTVQFSIPTQPAEFEGIVIDGESEEPIGGARISIRYRGDDIDTPPEATATTGPDGSFEFRDITPGVYDVEIALESYRDVETDVELPEGQIVDVEYAVRSEDENIAGQIREAGTRNRLSGMDVELLDANTQDVIREDFSRQGGQFSFRGVEPGDYVLRVSGSGYSTASFELEVVDGELTTGNFYIRADDYDGLRFRTTERRERSEVDRQTIGLEETRRMAGAGTDVVRVVENLPGVARQNYFGGQPIVRGAAPEDTSIFLEGDNIPIAFHFLGGPAVVNTEMIDSVDFYPGNFSARFGRTTAGVIDLQTRSPKDDRFHGYLEADLLDTSAIVEGPISDRWSFALSARRSYYDLLLPTVLDQFDTDIVVTPRYYDYQGWTTYRSEDGNHKVEFFLYGSDDTFELLLPDDQPEGDANIQASGADFGNSFHRGQFRWEWDSEQLPLETELMASFGRNSFGIDLGDELFFDLDYTTNQVRYDTALELTDNLELRSGIDSQIGPVNYSFAIPEFDSGPDDGGPNFGGEALDDERTTWQVDPGVYAELDYELFDRWTLIPGLRTDYYGSIRETSVSPRLASRFDVTDDITAKGGVGLFTQPPIPGQTEEDFGNPNLTFEKAIHYALGAEWQPADHLEVDTTLFYRDNYDLVSQTSAEELDDDGNRQPLIFDNAGEGRAYGWELLLRHYPRDGFFGWVSYTLSRSERLDRDTGEWQLFDSDQTHILTLVAGYDLPWNLNISGRFRLVTGNPQTPIVGASFDADSDTYRPRRGATNSERAGTFNQLDLRIDRTFIFNTWQMSAYLDVSNVYNATNPEGTQYNYDYTESAPLRGLPILPTIGLSARF